MKENAAKADAYIHKKNRDIGADSAQTKKATSPTTGYQQKKKKPVKKGQKHK